jgi:Uncharacterized protein conserved in bacteria
MHGFKRLRGTQLFKGLMAVAAGAVMMASAPVQAEYPDKPVTWVIPFPPGGPTDVTSRVLADAFSKELGQTFVSENKAGASGTIGVRSVIRDKSDGYTIATLAAPSLIGPHLMPTKPYDLSKDITPIGVAYQTPLLMVVNPAVLPNVTDLASLAAAAKEQDLNYTTAGVGSTAHLTVELIKKELGFDAMHIPYQGSAPAVTATLAGEVPMMFSDSLAVLPHIQSGKLRAIAVNTDKFEPLPDVKSLKDQGVTSTKAISWYGVFGPKDMPADVRDKLSATLEKVLQDPQVVQRMQSAGAYPLFSTPDAMAERIATDSDIWSTVIRENGITPQ